MYAALHVEYLLFSSDFNETLNFLHRVLKNTQISNFMKLSPMGTEFLHVDGRRDMTKLTELFAVLRQGLKSRMFSH